ncbi:hypothetical protein ABTF93_19785, partial [Acinetobacter baumannii]
TGVVYSPLADKWGLSADMDVNYMVVAEEMSPAGLLRRGAILSCAAPVDRAPRARHGDRPASRSLPCSPSPRSGFPSPSLLRSA